MSNSIVVRWILAISLAAFCGTAWSQAVLWPGKPIRLIVPAAAGGPTDLVARMMAEKLPAALGQPALVDNRPGAGHLIGTEAAARAAPDGYTFAFVTTPFVINPALQKKMPYDTLKDLDPVSWLTSMPTVLVVSSTLPVSSVQELVSLAKSRPGQLNMASAGVATGPHLAGALFSSSAGIVVTHVPYKGGPQASAAILSGEATFLFDTPAGTLPHIKSGKLRGLAVTSTGRSSLAPEIPALAESLPGYEFNLWQGVVAPAGTPVQVVRRMQSELANALALPDIKARFAGLGIEAVGSTPEQFGALIERDLVKWRRVVRDAGMSAD